MKKLFSLFFILFILPSICLASLEISINPPVAWQGKTMVVSVMSVRSVEGMFLGQRFRLFFDGEKFKGIIGVPVDQKVGEYNLRLTITKEDGSVFEVDKIVKVWATKFGRVSFRLPPAKRRLYVKELIEKEWAEIERVLTVEAEEQKWEGKFILPVQNIITMAFGTQEYFNGKKSSYHRGVDLRAKVGTAVYAPNHGKIVFARELKAFGGTIVIDHGQGIHTLYLHLSKILKSVDEFVSRGEIIAKTGNTGISTGPHLHWGLSVHNLRADPMQWLKQEI